MFSSQIEQDDQEDNFDFEIPSTYKGVDRRLMETIHYIESKIEENKNFEDDDDDKSICLEDLDNEELLEVTFANVEDFVPKQEFDCMDAEEAIEVEESYNEKMNPVLEILRSFVKPLKCKSHLIDMCTTPKWYFQNAHRPVNLKTCVVSSSEHKSVQSRTTVMQNKISECKEDFLSNVSFNKQKPNSLLNDVIKSIPAVPY